MKRNPKIILIHGNDGGTHKDHWFPYLKQELETLGLTVIANTFPDAIKARAKYWLPYIKDELNADENTIIIGHSSGAVAALRYAQSNKLLGTIIVGANHTDLGLPEEKDSGYFDQPWQWDKIKANQQWIVQYASTDDPWIPISESRRIHTQLDTEYYEYTDQGHFGSEDNPKQSLPELVEVIKEKLNLK